MPVLVLLYFIFIIISIVVIIVDKGRESNNNDNFSGGNLFYKYGQNIINSTIVIGVDGNNTKPLINLAEDLILYITNEIKQQFSSLTGRFQCDVIMIADRKMAGDQRKFIKVSVVTKRGSEITYFIRVVGVGKQLVIQEE